MGLEMCSGRQRTCIHEAELQGGADRRQSRKKRRTRVWRLVGVSIRHKTGEEAWGTGKHLSHECCSGERRELRSQESHSAIYFVNSRSVIGQR